MNFILLSGTKNRGAYTITLERLAKKGYESMTDYYFKVNPQLNEPLYTRPVRTVV